MPFYSALETSRLPRGKNRRVQDVSCHSFRYRLYLELYPRPRRKEIFSLSNETPMIFIRYEIIIQLVLKNFRIRELPIPTYYGKKS